MSPSRIDEAGSGSAGTVSNAPEGVAIVVLGAKGRMGQMVLQACSQKLAAQKSKGASPSLRVIGAVESSSSPNLGHPTGVPGIDVTITSDLAALLKPGVVVIDFTSPEASMATLEAVKKSGAAHVLCTTGLSASQKQTVSEAAKTVPIVMAPNMSMGVTLLTRVTEMVAKILGEDFDVEIVEAHHNQKKDSPSGTALGLAEAVARGHGVDLDAKANYGREGMVGARPKGEIGIHAVRGGDIVGDHTVLYAGDGERIELKHMAHSRMTFAQGAVKAALFLSGKGPGIYNMFDVLGL
ncbi:MAG: dihydrodipicolinate reductase [Fibrobacteres bacterium]|nr:dihydrodipicolinate reductase [Fibrobacterota bacterium]